MAELLRCPFCGSGGAEVVYRDNALSKWRFTAECRSTVCGASGSVAASKADAIENWNRRAAASGSARSIRLISDELVIEPTTAGESFYNQGLRKAIEVLNGQSNDGPGT